ncbi:MFS transporter [Candidatus Bathyarchaeota archaeon]|nr:MFS transporter [Candidatus Bathyarchaeota archaeon]
MADTRVNADWTLFVCVVTHVFVHVYSIMYTALLPVFISEFQLSLFESGLLASIPLLVSVTFSFPYALFADKINAKKSIALCLVMSGVSGLALTFAEDFVSLVFPLTLIQLSSVIYHPLALTIVSELMPTQRRSRALGIHGAGGTAGVAIGPITLGLVMGSYGWQAAYLIWIIPILLSTLFLLKLPDPSLLKSESTEKVDSTLQNTTSTAKNRSQSYFLLLLAITIQGLGAQCIGTYMTTYLVSSRGLKEDVSSLLYGLNSAVGIIGALGGGYLASYSGNKRWMTIANAVGMIVYFGIWQGPMWILVATYLVGGYFGASTMGPSTSLAAEFSHRNRRGLAYTIFMLPFSIIGAIAPIIAAGMIELYGIQTLFPFAISLTFISIIILGLLPKEKTESYRKR